jgi:hypothetical protein
MDISAIVVKLRRRAIHEAGRMGHFFMFFPVFSYEGVICPHLIYRKSQNGPSDL